ncbi:protein MMS22-like [Trichonephila clavata]|uniref:Protein MMS22-like n=1 Tax=Trichonephila clavata TaxID=2740835 RepID=A0A8X6F2J8_TRICU|nr:protein MMS22-like [Trichonephila clavata]
MDSDPSSIEYFDECFPSFDCKGQQNRTYLKSKHFFQCLHFQLHVQNKPLVTIFNKSFSSGSILWNDTEFLFGEIKKYFFLTRTLAIDKINLFQSEGPLIEVQKYRKCTVKAFQFLLNSLQHVTSEYCKVDARDSSITSNFPFSKLFFSILREIKNLLIFIGRISSASNLVHTMDFKETSLSAEYYYHYVHLYLDIWWHCITILLTLNHLPFRKEKLESFCNDVDQLDPFLQVISLILVDYIYIAIKNFSEVNSYCYHSPFLCKCFEDFWVMLIKVLDTKATDRKYSFWNIFHNAVQNLQKDSKNEKRVLNVPIDSFLLINEHMECKEIIEPCLWLISHIAPLYKIDAFGDYNEFENPKSGYEVVKYLVHSLLIDLSEKKEKSLRSSLFYILNLVTIWEPSCEILLPLVDFYIKKINEAFSVPGIEVKSLVYLFNSSMSWFQYINELSSTCTSLGNETSYDIFLRILCKQLIKDSNEGNLWRSLKGRMYSKFISKKILELSEIGLQNSFSLILAVATSGQLEVSDKICDLACIIKTSSSRKQLISWKALFVLMHIYQKKALKFNKIITKAVEFFNDACSEYSATRDSAHKANLMKLLVVYIDSMNELFEQSNDLKLSEYQLIGSGFSILLFSCGISELNYILRVFLNILIKVQCIAFEKHHANNVMYEQYIGLLELSFKHIFPFIEHISVTNTPPIYVSDIAAVLTILSQKFASTLTDRIAYNFCSIFLHFGTKDNVNSSIIRQYLCAVLDDEYLQSGIKEKILNFNSLIFQSWLKCIIDLFPSLKQMKCLTQKVIMQSDIADMFPKVKNIINNEIECENIATELFRIMGQTYDESTDLKHKHQLKLKMHDYFQKYVLIILTKVKKLQDNSTLSYVYKLTSCLVEYCSPLLYMKYNTQNILPQLFDNILVPAAVFPKDKHTQSILSNVIKDHMLGLIKGLFKLDYKNDKFVGRTLKDVMVNNMCIHLSSNNPIFKLCIDSIHNRKDGLKWDEFQFLLDVIKNYILNNSSNSIHAFEMIFEIFKSASLSKKQDISSILLKCTFETYMKQSISLSDYLRNLMCKIFMYFKDNMDLNDSKKILIPILQWFIQEKIPWSSARGFSVLDCFLEYLPQILSEIIPFLTKTVEELENSRGFGVDVTLRNHLKSTIAKLQEKLSVNHRKT